MEALAVRVLQGIMQALMRQAALRILMGTLLQEFFTVDQQTNINQALVYEELVQVAKVETARLLQVVDQHKYLMMVAVSIAQETIHAQIIV